MKNKKIVPERLRQARIIRGLNIQDLANKVGVTRQSISQYELGQSTPSPAIFRKIVLCLGFPMEFFNKPNIIENNTSETAFFRSYATAKKKGKEHVEKRADLFIEIYEYVSKYISFPKLNIPILDDFDISNNITNDKIDEIANYVRTYWKLGLGPVSDITLLLEKNGIMITRNIIEEEKLDGFYKFKTDFNRPFIFLSSDKNCAVRTRFDVAHELGHILLHQGVDREELTDKNIFNKIEDEANRFAAAFLLPNESFMDDIYSTSIDHFLSLKERWKVSISCMITRCKTLGLLTDGQYTYLQKQISIKKWRKKEPLDDIIKPENPVAIKKAINLLFEKEILTPYKLIEDLKMPIDEIESLTNLEPGTLSKKGYVIPLNIRKYN